MTDWLLFLSPWLALVCLIIWDARRPLDQFRNEATGVPRGDPAPLSQDFEALIRTIRREGVAYRKEEQREDHGKKVREWITIGLIFVTFVAVCYQVHEMIKVYDPIKQQAEDAKRAADATIRAADAATKQSENSDKSLVESQRAWVGPTIAKIDGAIEAGKPLKIVISYANSGREPALNFIYAADVFSSAPEEEVNGVMGAKMEAHFKGCREAKDLRAGQVVFPTTAASSNNLTMTTNAAFVDRAIVDGDKSVVIDGCFLYKSFEIVRHSYFCFFFKAKQTPPEGLNYCDNGAGAD